MNEAQIVEEIREMNLSYLMLAQSLIRSDKESALFRLGISDESAQMVEALSSVQIRRIASTGQLLCHMRFNDDIVFDLLTDSYKVDHRALPQGYDMLHASIVRSSKFEEAL